MAWTVGSNILPEDYTSNTGAAGTCSASEVDAEAFRCIDGIQSSTWFKSAGFIQPCWWLWEGVSAYKCLRFGVESRDNYGPNHVVIEAKTTAGSEWDIVADEWLDWTGVSGYAWRYIEPGDLAPRGPYNDWRINMPSFVQNGARNQLHSFALYEAIPPAIIEEIVDSAAFTDASGPWKNNAVVEAISVAETFAGFLYVYDDIDDVIDASDTTSFYLVSVISEVILAVGTAGSAWRGTRGIVEKLDLASFNYIIARVLIQESADLSDTLTDRILARIAEAMVAEGYVSTNIIAMNLVLDSALVLDRVNPSWRKDIAETVETLATVLDTVALHEDMAEAINSTSEGFGHLHVTMALPEEIEVSESITTRGVFQNLLSESIFAYVSIGGLTGDDNHLYAAWAVNSESLAPSQFDNYPFNSFGKLDQTYLGAMSDGIYELEGATDDGEPIELRVLTGIMDFETSFSKNVVYGYVGYTSDGRMLLKTYTSERGDTTERWYELAVRTGEGVSARTNRVKMARGVRSRYWQFELLNVEGAYADIELLEVMPVVLTRRM